MPAHDRVRAAWSLLFPKRQGLFLALTPSSPLHPQDPLSSLERQLALQLQITEAARRLCAEENLSRQARRQRKHAALQEEKKLRELERRLGDRRRNSEPPPTTVPSLGRGEPALLSCAGLSQHSPVLHFALCVWLLPVLMFLAHHQGTPSWVHRDPVLTYVPHQGISTLTDLLHPFPLSDLPHSTPLLQNFINKRRFSAWS